MRGIISSLLLSLIFLGAGGEGPRTDKATSSFSVVAYYPIWAVCDMPPQKIDFRAVTHIIWFWGEPTSSYPYFSLFAGSGDSLTLETGQPGWCRNPLDNGTNGLTNLKIMRDSCRANGVKLILCVGGEWGSPASTFSAMVADTTKQDTFIEAATGFAQRNGFDGIDIDWEFPDRGAAGRALYTRFLTKLRQRLDTWSPHGLITMAVPTWYWWDGPKTDPLIDLSTLNTCVDFVDLMEYGMENLSKISFHGPLYSDPAANQESWDTRGLNEWKGAGVNPLKLIPLIPFECTRMTDYSGISPVAIGHAAGGNQWTQLKNIPSNATIMWDDAAKNPWAYSGTTFYSFENSLSIAYKVQYARDQNVGGVGIWELWEAWLPNAPPGQQDPSLQAVKAAVGGFTPPVDSISPTISLSHPANGDSVSGIVDISANASDNLGVARVEFKINGSVAFSDFSPPYQFSWNASSLSGPRTISATAYDFAGNSASTPTITVYAKPLPPLTPEPWIYQDGLRTPWRDTSWNASNAYASTEQVYAGNFSVKTTQSAWGALSVRSGPLGWPADIDPAKYSGLEFWIYNTTPGLLINVYCYNDLGNNFPSSVQDTVPVYQWTKIFVPMSQLDPNGYVIHRVNIQNFTRLSSTYYVDNLHFLSAGPIPAVPTLTSPPPAAFIQTAPLVFMWDSSANATSYHIQVATDSLFHTIVINDASLSGPVKQVASLASYINYFWRVRSSNAYGTSSWSEVRRFLYINPAHWKLVSLPVRTADPRSSTVFPTALSGAFAFSLNPGYSIRDSLTPGHGYWMRFAHDQSANFSGDSIFADTVLVEQGWNLVGSISTPILVRSIASEPPGISTSRFFEYRAGYFVTDTIKPGQGYWVRSSQAAKLIFARGSLPLGKNTILTVADDELPPPPPGEPSPRPLPTAFALSQNYPNPFNPSTTISFALPNAAFVTLRVYDLLGREVAALVNEERPAGFYEERFQKKNLASGLYIYRLTAGKFSRVRKMLITK